MGHSTTPATFGGIPDGATELAIVDAWQYLSVAWVYRRQAGVQLDYYCTAAAWPETPACQLAGRDAQIAELHARVAELEAQLAAQIVVPPSVAAAATGMAVPKTEELPTEESVLPTEESALPPGRVQCPHCDKRPWAIRLVEHIAKEHPRNTENVERNTENAERTTENAERTEPQIAPIVLAADDPAWRCRQCESATFARSLRDPSLCQRCARSAPIAAANGHLAA